MRSLLIWAALALAILVPLIAAAFSPLLAYRQPVYIAAGLVGILAFGLLLVQPLLAAGMLPLRRWRGIHRWVGAAILALVVLHVGALWVTSPPDVIDALTFTSPTPFSLWGVLAMWAVFATAVLARLRRRLHPGTWRWVHLVLAVVISGGTVAHVLLIEGTMERWSKLALCLLVLAGAAWVIWDQGPLRRRAK